MLFKSLTNCQISGSSNLKLILSLGLLPPVNQMSKIGNITEDQNLFPTEIYYCPSWR